MSEEDNSINEAEAAEEDAQTNRLAGGTYAVLAVTAAAFIRMIVCSPVSPDINEWIPRLLLIVSVVPILAIFFIVFLGLSLKRFFPSRINLGCGLWIYCTVLSCALLMAYSFIMALVDQYRYGSYGSRVMPQFVDIGKALERYYDDFGEYPEPAVEMPLAVGTTGPPDFKLKYQIIGTADLPRLPLHDHGYGDRSAEGANPKFNAYFCCAADRYSSPTGMRPVYYTSSKGGKDGWILISAGPDRDYDIVPRKAYDPSARQPTPHLSALTYDPTNGTVSNGDIWRMSN